ncbi:MAG: hypothetical protein ACTSU4_04975 [Promethearchaeota archaeon]
MNKRFSILNFLKNRFQEMKDGWNFNMFDLFFIACYVFLSHGPSFYSFDGLYYFAQLISIFEDFDLNIYNNLKNFPLPIQKRPNQWSVGPAIFWAPFYIIGHFFYYIHNQIAFFLFGWTPPYVNVFWFNICVVNVGTIFYTWLGLKILGKSLQKYYSINPILVQVAVFSCTPLFFYVFSRPLMAHGISFFMVSVLLYLWVKWHDILNTKQLFFCAFILGLASLVRWQNVLFAVIFMPQLYKTLLNTCKHHSIMRTAAKMVLNFFLMIMGFILGFLPQLIAWQVQFGSPTPGAQDPSQFHVFNPDLKEVWFGQHGFFVWHPLTIVFLLGFLYFFLTRELKNTDGLVLLSGFFLQSYLWAIWYAPAAGCSFGMRGLIGTLPLLAFGFSTYFHGIVKMRNLYYRRVIITGFFLMIFIFSFLNFYLYLLLGHHFGTPILTCISKFQKEWFEEINWNLIKLALVYNLNFNHLIEKTRTLLVLIFLIMIGNLLQETWRQSAWSINLNEKVLN